VRALICPLYPRSTWAQPATVVAGTTVECDALVSVCSVSVGSASHCGGRHDRLGCFFRLNSFAGVGSASHCGGGYDR
jgi:hypothetical protein